MFTPIPQEFFTEVAKGLSEAFDTAVLFDGFPYVGKSKNIDEPIVAVNGALVMDCSLGILTKHMGRDSEWVSGFVHDLPLIRKTILDELSLACIVHHCILRLPGELSHSTPVRKRHARDMRVFASCLSANDEERYENMMSIIFGPLFHLYIDHLMKIPCLEAVEGCLADAIDPHNNGFDGAGQAALLKKRRRPSFEDSDDTDDDSGLEEATGAEAGPVPKRLNTGLRPASSGQDHAYLEGLPAIDADTQRLLVQARAEHPELGPVVNTILANPDLPTAPNGRATWGDVLKKYILPFASKRAFMTAAVLCLGVAVYRAHPEWVTILRESVSLPPQLRDMARSLPPQLTDMARNAASSLGLCEVAQDESMIQSLLAPPFDAGEVAQAEIIQSLEMITQEAQLDHDQVQHLIGFVKCEGSALANYNWYMDRQGSLSNSEFYSGLGKAVLCGAFTTLRIVKPLPA